MFKEDFLAKACALEILDDTFLAHLARDDAGLRNQISKWARSGVLVRLAKGKYLLGEKYRKAHVSRERLAFLLYPDSYVSRMTVLIQNRMVPEAYFGKIIRCVSLHKTRKIENLFGSFDYCSTKKELYRGFRTLKDENGMPYSCATPTKALLDHLYFDAPRANPSADYFEHSLRLQNVVKIKVQELRDFRKRYPARFRPWFDAILSYRKEHSGD